MLCYTKNMRGFFTSKKSLTCLELSLHITNDNNALSQKLARTFTFCTYEAMESNLSKFLLCTFLLIKTNVNEDSWKLTCVLPMVLRVCMLKENPGFPTRNYPRNPFSIHNHQRDLTERTKICVFQNSSRE